jgi:hypothetical protein
MSLLNGSLFLLVCNYRCEDYLTYHQLGPKDRIGPYLYPFDNEDDEPNISSSDIEVQLFAVLPFTVSLT